MTTLAVYAFCWTGMVVLAIINGGLREKGYGPHMGELGAHQLSTVIAIAVFGLYIWTLTGIFTIASPGQAAAIGGMWLAMTVLFEFGFGHFVMKHPWRRLFHDYNLCRGRLWLLLLVWTAIAPYVFFRTRS
jgi:hypothetical protein